MACVSLQQVRIADLARRASARGHADAEQMAGLVQSVSTHGVQVPVLAYREGESLVVLDGGRRIDAGTQAGRDDIPVLVMEGEWSETEILLRRLAIHVQREDLSPIDKARLIQRILERGDITASAVAAKTGMSPANVSKHLTLLLHPPDVQEQIASGKLPLSTAYELAKLPDARVRESLTREALEGRLSRDQLVGKARVATGRARPKRGARHTVVIPMGQGRSLAVIGKDVSVNELVSWLESLLARIRGVNTQCAQLSDVVKLVAAGTPSGG